MAATVAGFLGPSWWFFDLFCHFRVQWFLGLSVLATLFLFGRRKGMAAAMGVFAAINAVTLLPLYFGSIPVPPAAEPPIRALLINVNTQTGRPELVIKVIEQFRPDILILEEVNPDWLALLQPALGAFRHSEIRARDDNFGIALFTKFQAVRSEIRELGPAEVPTVIAELVTPSGKLTVIGTHPLPPADGVRTGLRNAQLEQIPALVREAGSPVVLLGDLNTTPWSAVFGNLLKASNLRDSSRGRGVQPTWPAQLPLSWIPIDHFLHSPELQVISKRTGPAVGSDHLPLLVEFNLKHKTNTPPANGPLFDSSLN